MKSRAPSEMARAQTLAFASYLRPYKVEEAYVRVGPSGLVMVSVQRLPEIEGAVCYVGNKVRVAANVP